LRCVFVGEQVNRDMQQASECDPAVDQQQNQADYALGSQGMKQGIDNASWQEKKTDIGQYIGVNPDKRRQDQGRFPVFTKTLRQCAS